MHHGGLCPRNPREPREIMTIRVMFYQSQIEHSHHRSLANWTLDE
jgi:hypothetical protein